MAQAADMTCCDVTFSTPEENLACDEALLLSRDQGLGAEVLRFWEPAQYFVVLGYANQMAAEVNRSHCLLHSIPVLRRCTGGGTVLQGPGVLNYSLVLATEVAPCTTITGANQSILGRHRDALSAVCGVNVEVRGQTDLSIGGLKFSGNAQRRGRRFLLFHGSLLLDLDLGRVQQSLLFPSRQPEYRRNRSHADFLMNLKLPANRIKSALREAWGANEPCELPRSEAIGDLVRDKYGRSEWNFKF
jgi:lipoate-protein ligase A